MTPQSIAAPRLHRIILVAVVTLLTSTGAFLITMDPKRIIVSSEAPPRAFGVGVNGDESVRKLRSRTHASILEVDEFLENRMLDFTVPSLSTVLRKFSRNPSNQDQVEQLFTKLKFSGSRSKLLGDPKFQTWARAVEKGYKRNSEAAEMAMASTLMKNYGDEDLAKLIMSAKEEPSTARMAAKLEEAQAKNWLAGEQSTDYVFRVLKLDKDPIKLLWSPLLSTWVSYVKMKKADPYGLLFEKMRKANFEDETIASLLGSAKEDKIAPLIVENIEKILFDTWMTKRQTADEIFTLLRLNKRNSHLFDTASTDTWVSYVTKLDPEKADEQICNTLRTHYSEHDITEMLAGSRKNLKADLAKRLEEQQHMSWLDEAITAKETFAKLKLNSQGGKLFESPAFKTWVSYVTKSDAQNADSLILSVLKTSYTDDALAKLLVAARADDNTKAVADKLAKAQLKDWLTNGKTADEVFNLLKLDDDVDNLLKSPLLNAWLAYADQLKENPYAILLAKLKASKLADSDAKLTDMLMTARHDATFGSVAAKIQAAQLDEWSSDGKTANDVFKLLDLKKEREYLLWYPRAIAWVDYVSKIGSKNSDEPLASVLKSHYNDDDLADIISTGARSRVSNGKETTTKLKEVVLRMWLGEKKSADDVFGYVLKTHHQFIFEVEGELNTWVSYVTKLEKEDTYKAMLAVLKRRFDKETLKKMLDDAEGGVRTKVIAEKLKQELDLS
ncbi:hypothetical protein ON010_g1406 [Phytophthora cinnamomi]|nr:hypothetical protein ON010_g1406 [Phytophthora cinnamomi]